jgi:hypothetical protein
MNNEQDNATEGQVSLLCLVGIGLLFWLIGLGLIWFIGWLVS